MESRWNENAETVGQNIHQARFAAKLSCKDLAEKIGRTQVTVSNWERGKTCPDVAILADVARALDVPFEKLVESVE